MAVELRVRAPRLHREQACLRRNLARFSVVSAGRRFGKTRLGVVAALEAATGHAHWLPERRRRRPRVWWIAPHYQETKEGWEMLQYLGGQIPGAKIRLSDRELSLPNGGRVTIRSAEDPEALRSAGLDFVVLDEAAHMDLEAVWKVVRPALVDRRGGALFISTPSGTSHYFWQLFLRGLSLEELEALPEEELTESLRMALRELRETPSLERDGWRSFQLPSAASPLLDEEELADARLDLGELAFAQEHLAEFIEPAGGMLKREWFRYFTELWLQPEDAEPDADDELYYRLKADAGHELVAAADCGRFGTVDLAASTKTSADWTAIGSFAQTPNGKLLVRKVRRDRFEGPDLVPAITEEVEEQELGWVGIESTGFQLTVVQQARRDGLPVRELRAEKDKISRSLVLAARLESEDVYFRAGASWLGALEAEVVAFPEGEHDDQVDMLTYAAMQLPSKRGRARVRSLADD